MTYSQGITGAPADSVPDRATLSVDDAAAGFVGAQQQSMRLGTAVLCKGPDGSLFYATIDASQYGASGSLTMLRLR